MWTEEEQPTLQLDKLKKIVVTAAPTYVTNPQRERSDSGPQASNTTIEEEPIADWTPEIPFENVSSRNSTRVIL